MRILLVGEVYSSNLGDGVICETAYNIIKKSYKDVEIEFFDLTFRSNFLEYNNFITDLSKFNNKKSFKQHIADYLLNSDIGEYFFKYREIQTNKNILQRLCTYKYDLCVFAGGSIFMDYFCLPVYEIIKICCRNKIPVIFNACGISKNENIILKKFMIKSLKSSVVKDVSLRDGYSYFKKRYNFNNPIIKSNDIAINCANEYNISKDEHSVIIGLGVMHIDKKEKELLTFWKNVIACLNKRKIKYKIFCNGDIYDYNFILKLRDMNIFETDKIEKRPEKPEELVELIASYNSILSFRLHSHIIAASLEIPSVAIVWNDKVTEFFKHINRLQYCFNIDADINDIIDCLQKANIDKNAINDLKKNAKENLLNLISKNIKDLK